MTPPPVTLLSTLEALSEEGERLDSLVTDLADGEWTLPTPAAGWTIAHQIAHLAWTDAATSASLTSTDTDDRFGSFLEEQRKSAEHFVDRTAARLAQLPPTDLLSRWRASRTTLETDFRAAAGGPSRRFPWFGPAMGLQSMITARLMETWAHGYDVADTLDITLPPSRGLRSISHLGVITRDFSYRLNGLTPPEGPFLVELESGDGEHWTWGPNDGSAVGSVRGPALDFCLFVTQRREPDDLALVFSGEEARRWSTFAQVFAGPPKSVMRGRSSGAVSPRDV
ncbi:TIGR03084 family metal-binding protein [Corynebacterium sp. USCH3]|uniref:TIGR03084 family metal-binding protein n=1 Tax=Corynebacterium sp. USCH3 TaxID=3024840 RepID=UPI0030AFB9A1